MHPLEMTARQMEWAGRNFANNLGYIPDDRFDWKPEPAAKSAREIVNHLAGILQGALGVAEGGEFKPGHPDVKTRAEAQTLMSDLATRHAAGLRTLQEADLERIIHLPFGDVPLAQAVLMSVIDTVHHHGQIVYLQTLLGDAEIHLASQ